jgi:hypothetical protein
MILGNLDKKNRKINSWIIFDEEGDLFVKGQFKFNKKEGWWYYDGCCRTFYENDKKGKTFCVTF